MEAHSGLSETAKLPTEEPLAPIGNQSHRDPLKPVKNIESANGDQKPSKSSRPHGGLYTFLFRVLKVLISIIYASLRFWPPPGISPFYAATQSIISRQNFR